MFQGLRAIIGITFSCYLNRSYIPFLPTVYATDGGIGIAWLIFDFALEYEEDGLFDEDQEMEQIREAVGRMFSQMQRLAKKAESWKRTQNIGVRFSLSRHPWLVPVVEFPPWGLRLSWLFLGITLFYSGADTLSREGIEAWISQVEPWVTSQSESA